MTNSEVAIGDFIVIKPGEKIPLDGKISEGSTLLDTSAITGESLPREVTVGDAVYSGSINKNGLFTIEVTKLFGESTVSKILDLVQNASSKKAPTEKFITKFARYYTPTVVTIAFVLAIVPPLVIPGASFSDWIYRALAFLVVSCPCALVISIPLGYFGGIGAASKNGILVKGSNYLEALTKVNTVVFDKTGTLTKGVFSVTKVQSILDSISKDDLLKTAAYAEYYSNHPIAKSIVVAFGAQNVNPEEIKEFDEKPGKGIKVKVDGLTILAGNAKFLESENIQVITADEMGTIVHISINHKYTGYIVISDEVKHDSQEAIRRLKSVGIAKIAMLTGDIESVGKKIARDLGIDEVFSELLPSQKVEKLEAISDKSRHQGKIAFVGDGINDAPVLARADVGISMGALGSDAAIEAADIVIMTDHPSKVADAILIARKTNWIVWQNIIFAFTVKVAVLVMSAGGVATLWEAVFADMGVALIAIFNSIRVLNYKENNGKK